MFYYCYANPMDQAATSPPAARDQPRSGRRLDRQQVFDVAAALLEEQGPQALAVRVVAQRAQVSVQAVYTLFGSKAGLCEALFVEGFTRLQAALNAVAVTAEPVTDVIGQVHAYREAALAGPGLYAIMFGRPVPEFQPSAAALAAARATLDGLVDGVRRATDNRTVPPPEQAAQVVWALNHGLVSLELGGHLPGGEEGRVRLERATRDLLRSWSQAGGATGAST